MIHPICFYSIARREVIPPDTVVSPIFFPRKMIQCTPNCGIAYFDYCGNRVNAPEEAGYVVYPNIMPPPQGFQWCGGAHPNQIHEVWQANAAVLSDTLYRPSALPNQLPALQPVQHLSTIASPPVEEETDEQYEQYSLAESSQGYIIISNKNHRKTRASNYLLRDVTMVHYLKQGQGQDDISVQLMIEVVSPPISPEVVEIAVSDLDSVGNKIGKQLGTAIAYPGVKASFFNQFSILIRERLAHCQHRYIYLSTGWALLPQGRWVYVHDSAKPPYDNVVFRSNFKFGSAKNAYSSKQLVQNAWELLSLSQNKAAILIPFLFAHLSLLWSLFSAAGYPPHVLLFIKGTTGSFKTAVASLLFNFTGIPTNNIPASFRDTSASMEVRMEKYRDRALLVDDFCPAASENAKRVLEQNLEQLVRFYGDGVAKARTNPRLEEVTEKRPQGLCVITGEDSAGSYSSLLRCLFISVDPKTYDKVLLTKFQAEPTMWTGYLQSFIDYCVNSAPNIIAFIQERFQIYRDLGGRSITERRLTDAYVDLCLAGTIALDFAYRTSAISADERDSLFTQFNEIILTTCVQSADESKALNPVQIFARTLMEAIEKRSVLLASREEFELAPDKFSGYRDGEYWYFWGANLYDSIRREYSLLDKKFPLSQTRLWEALYIANVLIPSKPRESSGSKFEYGVKVSFGNRPRLIRISPSVLKNYL